MDEVFGKDKASRSSTVHHHATAFSRHTSAPPGSIAYNIAPTRTTAPTSTDEVFGRSNVDSASIRQSHRRGWGSHAASRPACAWVAAILPQSKLAFSRQDAAAADGGEEAGTTSAQRGTAAYPN
jgi:hypothetical protein